MENSRTQRLDPIERFEVFWNEQAAWSQKAFGSDADRGPLGPLRHLVKEATEAQDNPADIMEFVDCLFLVVDSSRRAGFSCDELLNNAFRKLEINKAREWQKPTSGDQPVEHVRE